MCQYIFVPHYLLQLTCGLHDGTEHLFGVYVPLVLYQAELERLVCKKGSRQSSPSSLTSFNEPQIEPEDLSITSSKQPAHDLSKQDTPHHAATITSTCVMSSREADSPLQQMQNITNQFLSSSQAHLLQQKPLKHVLPPISQEQFDKYTGLNTEELVKKVSSSALYNQSALTATGYHMTCQ